MSVFEHLLCLLHFSLFPAMYPTCGHSWTVWGVISTGTGWGVRVYIDP